MCQSCLSPILMKKTPILFQKQCNRLKTPVSPESQECLVRHKQKSLEGVVGKLIKGLDSAGTCFCPSAFPPPFFFLPEIDRMLKEKQPSSECEAQNHKQSLEKLKNPYTRVFVPWLLEPVKTKTFLEFCYIHATVDFKIGRLFRRAYSNHISTFERRVFSSTGGRRWNQRAWKHRKDSMNFCNFQAKGAGRGLRNVDGL